MVIYQISTVVVFIGLIIAAVNYAVKQNKKEE